MSQFVQDFLDFVVTGNPLHEKFLNRSYSELTAEEKGQLANLLQVYGEMSFSPEYLAACYLTIVNDSMNEQLYFRRHKKYRYSKFQDVCDSVYYNAEYMRRYMVGLALTQFLWPNHRALWKFFAEIIRSVNGETYLEVGPGHGLYLMEAIKGEHCQKYMAVDLSDESLRLTRAALKSFSVPEISVELIKKDFFDFSDGEGFDAFVMGEVLEHVERPAEFLRKAKSVTHKESFLYVSTCLNAPAIDHIYLFETQSQLEDIVNEAGLKVANSLWVPHEGKNLEECIEKSLPINVGLVLEHA